jgi:hypothetical protein
MIWYAAFLLGIFCIGIIFDRWTHFRRRSQLRDLVARGSEIPTLPVYVSSDRAVIRSFVRAALDARYTADGKELIRVVDGIPGPGVWCIWDIKNAGKPPADVRLVEIVDDKSIGGEQSPRAARVYRMGTPVAQLHELIGVAPPGAAFRKFLRVLSIAMAVILVAVIAYGLWRDW